MNNLSLEEARQLAAQAWCHDRNSKTVMDADLAESFAEILVTQTSQAAIVGGGDWSLRNSIASAINYHSRESYSDTQDFVLAEYLFDCLTAFERATLNREKLAVS